MRTSAFKWRYRREGHGLLRFGLGVQFVGGVEGAVEVKAGTFLAFKARKPVLLVVPNRVAPSPLLLSHRVSKRQRHGMSSPVSSMRPSWRGATDQRQCHAMLDHFGPLFVVGSAVALLGWAVVVLTSRIERQRQEAHRERFAEPERGPLPQWARVIRQWLRY